MAYLKDQVDSREKELFLVVSREVDNNQGWLCEAHPTNECSDVDKHSITYIEDGYSSNIDLKKSVSEVVLNENEHFQNNQNSR